MIEHHGYVIGMSCDTPDCECTLAEEAMHRDPATATRRIREDALMKHTGWTRGKGPNTAICPCCNGKKTALTQPAPPRRPLSLFTPKRQRASRRPS